MRSRQHVQARRVSRGTRRFLAAIAGAAALAACAADSTMPREGVPAPSLDIRDGRSGGSYRFFFQPPIAPFVGYSGTFDPAARPLVRVTQLNPPGPVVAQFTDTSGVAIERSAEQYAVSWRTSTCNVIGCRLEPGRTYRVFVLDPRAFFTPLGWADVRLVRRAADLPLVPPGEVGVVFGQVLPIRFRIERSRVAFVKVSPVQSVLDVGQVQALVVTATDSSGNVVPNATALWLSSNASVAPVSASGLTTGLSPGSAALQAIVDGVASFALVTVQTRPALRIVPARAVIPAGQKLQLVAADAFFVPVPGAQWFAPDPQFVVVSATGEVTGVAPGVGRVRALINTAMYEALVTVQGPRPQVNVMPPRDSLRVGQQDLLFATDVTGAPIPSSAVTWLSTNSAVAAVSPLGNVVAVAPGIATILAVVGPATGRGTVVVVPSTLEVPPAPQQPRDSMRVRQDDPTIGCNPGPGGYGFSVLFQWSPGSGPKPRDGEHIVVRDSSGGGGIDVQVGATPMLAWGACGVEVPDDLLDGWTWRAQTRYTDGTFGPFSPPATFGFLPKNTSPDLTSYPHDYGPGKIRVSVSGATDALTSSTVQLSIEYRMPSGLGFLPASAVQFHWFDGRYYRLIGSPTGCLMTDNGLFRFFRCSLAWDPGPPVGTGTFPIVATVVDGFRGGRFVGTFQDVTVVP